MVLDSGITEDQLRKAVQLAVDHHDNMLDAFWDNFHPLLPLLMIYWHAGLSGDSRQGDRQNAIEIGLARGVDP